MDSQKPSQPLPAASGQPLRERRKHPRVQAEELPLKLHGQEGAPLRVRDISKAGVAFFSDQPIALMTRVRFTLEFPGEAKQNGAGEAQASGEGVVVRCERLAPALGHFEVAVFFSELPERARQALAGFLDHRLANNAS